MPQFQGLLNFWQSENGKILHGVLASLSWLVLMAFLVHHRDDASLPLFLMGWLVFSVIISYAIEKRKTVEEKADLLITLCSPFAWLANYWKYLNEEVYQAQGYTKRGKSMLLNILCALIFGNLMFVSLFLSGTFNEVHSAEWMLLFSALIMLPLFYVWRSSRDNEYKKKRICKALFYFLVAASDLSPLRLFKNGAKLLRWLVNKPVPAR